MKVTDLTAGRRTSSRVLALSLLVALLGLFVQGLVSAPAGAGESRRTGRSATAQDKGDEPDEGDVTVAPSVEAVDTRGEKWLLTGVSQGGVPTVSSSDDGSSGDSGSSDEKNLEATPTDTTTDVVIVIDNDRSLPNGNLQLSGDAAAALLPGVGPIRSVGVVSTAKKGARIVQSLTSDQSAVTRAIDGIGAEGDAATWDAMSHAADMLAASDASMKRVVAYLGAPNKLSGASAGAAETRLRLADARLDAMVLLPGAPAARLAEMVNTTGGSLAQLTSDEGYAGATETEFARISSQFRLQVTPPAGEEQFVNLEVAVPGVDEPLQVTAERASLNVGSFGLAPHAGSQGLLDSLLSNAFIYWLAILALGAAVVGLVWSVLNMVVPDANSLSSRLQVYEEGEGTTDDGLEVSPGMMSVPILQRAVDFTGEMAEKRGFLESIEVSLERASLPLRAPEAMFFAASLSVLAGILATVLSGSLLIGLVVLGFGLLIPKAALDFLVKRRQKKFVAQLPDMLTLLAGTLKAGYSIAQAFESVSREVGDPMGKELRRVVTEHRLGRTLEDALDATAERMGSDDFAWTVMAIKIQREVGGNLAELLLTVANTMTLRERLRRDVNSLTAEGRVSAFVLGMLPPALGVVMFMMNRDYIMTLFTPGMGYFMIGAAVVAMIIGFMWMKKIITIEV